MAYIQFQPHPQLAPYIDAYWLVTNDEQSAYTNRILPDGCVDIILNVSAESVNDSDFLIESGTAYLVGTMTRFKEVSLPVKAMLIGIRFKSAGFSSFYHYSSLHELTDLTVEFDKKLVPDLKTTINFVRQLDDFFLSKLLKSKHSLFLILADIQNSQGQINIDALTKRHFIAVRQLERNFKYHVGISPKEYINLVRYQCTLAKIQNNFFKKSLLDIAFESGYYDHSHLTNAIKKYTGWTPSQF